MRVNHKGVEYFVKAVSSGLNPEIDVYLKNTYISNIDFSEYEVEKLATFDEKWEIEEWVTSIVKNRLDEMAISELALSADYEDKLMSSMSMLFKI